jgi:hypothetical protein
VERVQQQITNITQSEGRNVEITTSSLFYVEQVMQLTKKQSVIFIAVFAFATLALRIWIEDAFSPPFWLSSVLGLAGLGCLYVLIRMGFLRFVEPEEE